MILTPRHITSSPILLITAGVLTVIFILGALGRPSWPSSLSFSRPYSSEADHGPAPDRYDPPANRYDPPTDEYKPPSDPPSSQDQEETESASKPPRPDYNTPTPQPQHPIDKLIKDADELYDHLMKAQIDSDDVGRAASVYRERRQRHPPPGFDRWFEYARSQHSVIVEDMFDQIYHDLEPFWSAKPENMRNKAISWPFSISIRGGEARKRQKRLVSGEWLDYWETMFKQISQYLPDVDIALNQIDESRIVVPYENMRWHMKRATASRSTAKPASQRDVVDNYPTREALSFEKDDIADTGLIEKEVWLSKEPFWEIARKACGPESEAHNFQQDEDMSKPPTVLEAFPKGSYEGFVSNWTLAKDVCTHTELRNIHGNLVSPRFTSVNTTLFPLFSGCKIQGINNEILLPAAKYFSDEEEFSNTGSEHHTPWESKSSSIIWRGQATGGAHNKNNWKRFHRHRFVAMLNGSLVSTEEESAHSKRPSSSSSSSSNSAHPPSGHQFQEVKGAFAGIEPPPPPSKNPQNPLAIPHNIPRPDPAQNPYNLSALQTSPTTLGAYLSPKTNISFDHLMCDPWSMSILGSGKECGYLDHWYEASDRVGMEEQYAFKYLPDVDGNSYSGRYRAFLRSGSLPLKATIWSEWHDHRLVPWKHFVPFHSSYVDLWAILEYFWGYGTGEGGVGSGDGKEFIKGGFREGEHQHPELGKRGHDTVARRIAEEGQAWGERVLRREDMLVYVYRLVLEYARVVSEERDGMNFVKDLF